MQCDLIVPDELKPTLSNFPPIFKNIDVSRNNIGEYMKNYAEENDLLKNPQQMLISSFKLENGTIITPLLNFYLSLGLQCTKKHDKRESGLFKEEFRCTEMLCLCSKLYCCYDSKSDKFKFSSKGLNKRTLEDTGDGPMSKYRRVLDDDVNLK